MEVSPNKKQRKEETMQETMKTTEILHVGAYRGLVRDSIRRYHDSIAYRTSGTSPVLGTEVVLAEAGTPINSDEFPVLPTAHAEQTPPLAA